MSGGGRHSLRSLVIVDAHEVDRGDNAVIGGSVLNTQPDASIVLGAASEQQRVAGDLITDGGCVFAQRC